MSTKKSDQKSILASGPEGTQQPSYLRENSLHLLEFHLVREKLAGYATFPPARELALELMPSCESAEVARLQEETTEARRFLERRSSLELAKAKDLRQPLERAALGGVLTGEDLRDVQDTLTAVRGTRAAVISQKDIPGLVSIARGLPVLRELEADLKAAIGRSGEVLDGATSTLKELRGEVHSAYQHLMESLERTVRRLQRQNILQEPIITQRNGRMVLLVKSEMKNRQSGIVHDVSDSRATVFLEPMSAIGPGNRWRELRLAQEREEEKVLRFLSAKVEAVSNDLLRGREMLAQLDLAVAKARYSLATNSTSPTMIDVPGEYVWLLDARHPLLEGEVVPTTVKLGDRWSLLLITGPNAGGKTVALKTIGLLTLMAQAGLHVPAREANLSLFDGVYADIGDQQSIQLSLSTFSSHIQNISVIMKQATSRSLVLIDELGSSTDPEEGAALAKAILLHFSRHGITLVATTHQRDVANFVQDQPGMMNASVELDPRTLAPTYRLTSGLPGRSYALTIASRLGMDAEITEDAQNMLSPGHQRAESLLMELQQERHLAEQKSIEAEEALAQAQTKSAELAEQLVAIEDRKAEMVEETRAQLQRKVDDIAKRLRRAERALEQPSTRRASPVGKLPIGRQPAPEEVSNAPEPPVEIPTIKEEQEQVAEVAQELRSVEWKPPPSRRASWLERLQSGDRVYLRDVPQPVEIITPPDDGGTVEVLLGTMRARFPVYQLARPARAHTAASRDGIYYARSVKRQVNNELDLHGVRVEEAIARMESFLNDATLAGLSSVRIGHGVGTGALRSAIREHLEGHPLVKSFRRDERTISDATTVVELA